MVRARVVTARDLMRGEVVALSESLPIAAAVETLEEYGISGAPVIDEAENLVGILSLSDIARTEHLTDGRIDGQAGDWRWAEPEDTSADGRDEDAEDAIPVLLEKEDYSPPVRGTDTVGTWMTHAVISVAPGASMEEVCRTMVESGVHRVLVVDGRRLVGIVTTMDVVRFLAGEP